MIVQIATGGKKYQITFEKGITTEKCKMIEDSTEEQGTTVIFKPDNEIWEKDDPLNIPKLRKRIKQLAYLNRGLRFYFYPNGIDKEYEEYYFEKGLSQYVNDLTESKKKLLENPLDIKTSKNDIDIQFAFTYTDVYTNEIYTFCNNMFTEYNGDHLTGFTMGFNNALKHYMKDYDISFEMTTEDVKEGLTAIIAVTVSEPNFEGQSKAKLVMKSVKDAIKEITENAFYDYLDKNPDNAKIILAKIESASKARIAAQKAREASRKNKSLIEGGNPSKLAECSSKNPEECEIFLVEG